ncbi:MAG: ABC transporter substrate-binding protein [Hyphomicrobiaceae bacterium]
MTIRKLVATAALAASSMACAIPGTIAADKLVLALPGVPPVFSGLSTLVARDAGIFKKYNLDVDVKFMDSGAAAAKAVVSGNIDVSMSPTQFVAALASNAGAPVSAIWGLDHGDWVLGSMDPKRTGCDGMKGGGVGVDSKGGARWIQLNTYLIRKCKLKIDADVKTVPLSSNVGTAMASGQITFGVLHLDDIPAIEKKSGKKVAVFARIEDVSPDIHYLMLIARKDNIAKKKDAFVRLVAALRDAADMIHDPNSRSKVAAMAKDTARPADEAAEAIAKLVEIDFWPKKNDPGLSQKRIVGAIANQVRVGKISKGKSGINPSKTPIKYEALVDLSLFEAAKKLK